jgi:hypothetical protein
MGPADTYREETMHTPANTTVWWISLLFLLVLQPAGTQGTAAAGEKIQLQWAFGALTGPEDNQELLSIEEKAVLHTGDRMKFFLQPQTDCFVYLFYRSSQGELVVLLPAQGSESRSAAGTRTTIPPGIDWFRLDEVVGTETFYLLASARPLEKLDNLCNKLHAAAQHEREAVSGQILTEINRLQKKRRRLTAAAERPIRLGGNFRGTMKETKPALPDISQIAVEISASDFYTRTYTIDHR